MFKKFLKTLVKIPILLIFIIALSFVFSIERTEYRSLEQNISYTVYIKNGSDTLSKIGTGILINSQYVLTVNHILQEKNEAKDDITIATSDGQIRTATVVAVYPDKNVDLALLKLNNAIEIDIPVFKCSTPNLGEKLYAIGNPNGLPWITSFGRMIKSISPNIPFLDMSDIDIPLSYYINIPVFHGNSGGPVFDENTGFVVGIVTAIQYWHDEFGMHPSPITLSQYPETMCKFMKDNHIDFKENFL